MDESRWNILYNGYTLYLLPYKIHGEGKIPKHLKRTFKMFHFKCLGILG